MTEKYIRKPNTHCGVCRKAIYRRPSEIERNAQRVYCSQRCYGISCRRETPCIVCKKPILSGLHRKTCSRACANKNRTGVAYNTSRPNDKVVTQRALKLRLLNERGTICERCSYNKAEVLQVHHINRNRKQNNLENLELICPNCHFEEHYLEKSWLKTNRYGGVG